MIFTTDTIVKDFPHPTIPPIIGIPTYATIAEVNLKLNANAAFIHSILGNGALGILALTVKKSVYDTFSSTPFTAPTNPGAQLEIPSGFTGPQISQINHEHEENL